MRAVMAGPLIAGSQKIVRSSLQSPSDQLSGVSRAQPGGKSEEPFSRYPESCGGPGQLPETSSKVVRYVPERSLGEQVMSAPPHAATSAGTAIAKSSVLI